MGAGAAIKASLASVSYTLPLTGCPWKRRALWGKEKKGHPVRPPIVHFCLFVSAGFTCIMNGRQHETRVLDEISPHPFDRNYPLIQPTFYSTPFDPFIMNVAHMHEVD